MKEKLTVEKCLEHIRRCKDSDKCGCCPFLDCGRCGIVEALEKRDKERKSID